MPNYIPTLEGKRKRVSSGTMKTGCDAKIKLSLYQEEGSGAHSICIVAQLKHDHINE